MNLLSKKSIIPLLCVSFLAWNEAAIGETILKYNKVANKTSRALKNGWSYETGQILGVNLDEKMGDYILYEQIKAQKPTNAKKSSSYTMSILFQRANAQETITIQGNHNFSEKQYSGSVISATAGKAELIGAHVEGDDKVGQLTLTYMSIANPQAIQPIDVDRDGKLAHDVIQEATSKQPTDYMEVVVSMVFSEPMPVFPLDPILLSQLTHEEAIAYRQEKSQALEDYRQAFEPFFLKQTESFRRFASSQGWGYKPPTFILGSQDSEIVISLPVGKLPQLRDRADVKHVGLFISDCPMTFYNQ